MPSIARFRFVPLRSSLAMVCAAACALALVASPAVAQTGVRIAVVDLDRVVAQSPGGQELGKRLEAFQKEAAADVEAMSAEARDIRQRLADGVNTLSEEKLAELQKSFEDKTIEIRRLRDDKQREGQKLQNEGLKQIEQELEPVFERIRDEQGYDLILNRVPGVVLMAGEKVDITQSVIDALSASAAAGG
ncbi:MAG: OmpH family outer membrane protein [Acidobacteriota bacterium]